MVQRAAVNLMVVGSHTKELFNIFIFLLREQVLEFYHLTRNLLKNRRNVANGVGSTYLALCGIQREARKIFL